MSMREIVSAKGGVFAVPKLALGIVFWIYTQLRGWLVDNDGIISRYLSRPSKEILSDWYVISLFHLLFTIYCLHITEAVQTIKHYFGGLSARPLACVASMPA